MERALAILKSATMEAEIQNNQGPQESVRNLSNGSILGMLGVPLLYQPAYAICWSEYQHDKHSNLQQNSEHWKLYTADLKVGRIQRLYYQFTTALCHSKGISNRAHPLHGHRINLSMH